MTPFDHVSFSAALEKARAEQVPVMALRPDHEFPGEMDDIVVKNCDVHLEAMSATSWWMACTFENGEEVVFWFSVGKNPKRIVVRVGDQPGEWCDWDELYREARGG